jgi:hypothetical protein
MKSKLLRDFRDSSLKTAKLLLVDEIVRNVFEYGSIGIPMPGKSS